MSSSTSAKSFLNVSHQFQLGRLLTESFHPKTRQLSQALKKETAKGLRLLSEVDHEALDSLTQYASDFWELYQDITTTLNRGNRIFMSGCGATGRLALVLETLFTRKFGEQKVISFMAGGDFALIKSVESFEDQTSYGHRQLMELGFQDGDLLIATSEGGETPFVIGSAQKASEVSRQKPYFIYCNPSEQLKGLDRCEEIFSNQNVKKKSIPVGPMAISGSTRMQASTALMFVVGECLLYQHENKESFCSHYQEQIKKLYFKYENFSSFTDEEFKYYQENKVVNYISDPSLAISILTDTTERSPTFSLNGFENFLHSEQPASLSYLFVKDTNLSEQGWQALLCRPPRALSWKDLNRKIDLEEVYGFDISMKGLQKRKVEGENFEITLNDGIIKFKLGQLDRAYNWGTDLFIVHLKLKMLLNAHSTSVMGLLGRFEGNVMSWVRPSNNKLIDRSARYIKEILDQRGVGKTYEEIVHLIFEELKTIKENEPIVMKVVDRI